MQLLLTFRGNYTTQERIDNLLSQCGYEQTSISEIPKVRQETYICIIGRQLFKIGLLDDAELLENAKSIYQCVDLDKALYLDTKIQSFINNMKTAHLLQHSYFG